MGCNLGTVTNHHTYWYKQVPGGAPQFVLRLYKGVSGVTVVTQKPPVLTVSKGETATMDCSTGVNENTAVWYKQVPDVSGVTVVTQKPPVLTVRKGQTATMG
ncbi:hypothetical protein JZ751_021595, partial [Albula glossodonta]